MKPPGDQCASSLTCNKFKCFPVLKRYFSFISRRLQTQIEAFKTAEAASGKQTKVFICSSFIFYVFISGTFKCVGDNVA